MTLSWLSVALGAASLFACADPVSAQAGRRQPASPGYRGRDACPSSCSISGANPANWSAYHNFDQFQSCPQTLFYEFSLYDQVDDSNALHRIYACTSYGSDWENVPGSATEVPTVQSINATYDIGWWPDGTLAAADIRILTKQIRQYLANGLGATDKTVRLFAQSGQAAVGLYIGKGLQNEAVGSFALKTLEDSIPQLGVNTESLAMQLCQGSYNVDHIFGFMATSNATFGPVQDALKSWSNAQCLSFEGSKSIAGPALLTTPLVISTNATNSTVGATNATCAHSKHRGAKRLSLSARGDCRTIQVKSGDSCAALASRCGISGADFTKYNPNEDFCATLMPFQHVCCSSGTVPDMRPKRNPDGSCATYPVHGGDFCAGIAASNGITIKELEKFNEKTWGWNGCSNIWAGTIICVSSGTPPMPAPVPGTVCGPQVPGTQPPTDGTDIADLNPCPLNACCDVWGQCGTTEEFCTDTSTGAPGTAEPGTNGCISNCGTNIVRSSAPTLFRKIGYFEGFGLGRPCLHQDALQIDESKYTHLHFAFGQITPDYDIHMGDPLTKYEFDNFKRLRGTQRILSFGGWEFSTGPSTYNILRQGVMPANRLRLARNIANFIKYHDLDGVDIDWEYPSLLLNYSHAPDIPGIPPGDKAEGVNYLGFLAILKNLLPGKSVSIAAPASYWYLKGFPIDKISKIVDYIVYMTYDLHGQWDAQNQYSQVGCPNGMCLRNHVNLTETVNALVMITKAGVPSNKVVVGVSSYGRSFAMAEAGCHTPDCQYTGTAAQSNAKKGPCTDTAGYISNAEINDILRDLSRVNQNYVDLTSNSNILVYDDTQWVGWMSPEIKDVRTAIYWSLNMGGTTDWAIDLESYHDPPRRSNAWATFKELVGSGMDPYQVGGRTGNWTSVTCTDRSVEDLRELTPSERWNMMGAPDAWTDVIDVWKKHDHPRGSLSFLDSVSDTLHGPEKPKCNTVLGTNNCEQTLQCSPFVGSGTGAAAYVIWNSLVLVHEIFASYHDALYKAAASSISNSLQAFEDKFAPVPPPPDNAWLMILLDFVSIGAPMVAGPFFNSFLSKLPYFTENPTTMSNIKDVVMALISGSISLTKDLSAINTPEKWNEQKQHEFSAYMGQAISIWGNITETALFGLFDGSDESISQLTTVISDGKLIPGKGHRTPSLPDSETVLEASISKAFFVYAIPAIWALSGVHPFIADSGFPCGKVDPLGSYLSKDTMHATAGCYQGKLYYLVTPKGSAETCSMPNPDRPASSCSSGMFSAPPGIDSLGSESMFGGITVGDLITGSVRTYIQNGNANGGGRADAANSDTVSDLFGQDVTTPGFIRIPVCSPAMAYKAWRGSGSASTPNYPCIIPPGRSECGESTFVDQTSAASPPVSDCLQLIKNIEGTDGKWDIENAIGNQHQIAQFGRCRFGVTGLNKKGNIDFHVGTQDIIDIINDSINKFGGSGRVGSKGRMSCRGTVKGQDVEWGLY